MSSSKSIYLQRDFAAGVCLSDAPSPPMTPYTLYSCILYTYSPRDWGGELFREKVKGTMVHKDGSKITT